MQRFHTASTTGYSYLIIIVHGFIQYTYIRTESRLLISGYGIPCLKLTTKNCTHVRSIVLPIISRVKVLSCKGLVKRGSELMRFDIHEVSQETFAKYIGLHLVFKPFKL